MAAIYHLAEVLLTRLAWTSVQVIVLVGVIAGLTRLLPRLSAAARCVLWWLVGLQVVLGFCWQTPIQLPLLSPSHATALSLVGQSHALTHISMEPASVMTLHSSFSGIAAHFAWSDWLIVFWLLGIGAQLPMLIKEHKYLRTLLDTAQPPPDPNLLDQCAKQAHQLELRRSPKLMVSHAITSPLITGWWRPVILWPSARNLTPDEAELALAHELAHLKRGDLWLGCVPALAQRLLFFHPFVRWAVREYAIYREAACDARVVQARGVRPHEYGKLLLRFGVTSTRRAGLAGAPATFDNLKRRLIMLQRTADVPSFLSWPLFVLIAVFGALPYRVIAASSPAIPLPGSGIAVCCGHSETDIGVEGTLEGVLLFDKGNVLINGTNSDVSAAKPFYNSTQTLLWFRRGSRVYLERDGATIQRAKNLYAPARAALQRLDDVIEQQGATSSEQGKLSEQAGTLSEQQADLALQQSNIETQVAETGSSSAPAKHAAIEAEKRELESHIQRLNEQRMQLNRQQKILIEQQTELDQRQQTLEIQVHKAARQAQNLVHDLLSKAIASGLAQEVGDN